MNKLITFCFCLLCFVPFVAYSQQAKSTDKIVIEVVWEPALNAEVLAIRGVKYNTVALLKSALAAKPAGTVVVWDPGCVRVGEHPMLSTQKELNELRQFLEKKGLKFIERPSG